MSKKAFINTSLFFCLAVIWGLVIRKAFFRPAPDELVSSSVIVPEEVPLTVITRDTMPLNHITNPFLNQLSKANRVQVAFTAGKNKKTRARVEKDKKKVVWPSVQYVGFVKAKNNALGALALIKMNNALERLRQGEERHGITLKAIYKDSIQIAYAGEMKVVKR